MFNLVSVLLLFVNVATADAVVLDRQNPGMDDFDISCYEKDNIGLSYRGLVSMTVSGRTCAKWTTSKPTTPMASSMFSNDALWGNHNYCRNFKGGNMQSPWCFAVDTGAQELCEIPKCPEEKRDFQKEHLATVGTMKANGLDCGCADELYGSTRTTRDTAVGVPWWPEVSLLSHQ